MSSDKVTYGELLADQEKLRTWLLSMREGLYIVFLGDRYTSEDGRNAALAAIRALDYLATPPERVEVTIKRPSWEEYQKRYDPPSESPHSPN